MLLKYLIQEYLIDRMGEDEYWKCRWTWFGVTAGVVILLMILVSI